ncbi:MAG TPA: hypothetical protein VHE55_19150 [Fimbriimonadaceae bacterium]|nr:hypothetical protein [Fimbriimonadaceae bacterium]
MARRQTRWLAWILFPLATVDFWLLGWCLPSKEGMRVNLLTLSIALVAACSAVWLILRFGRKDKPAVIGWLVIVALFASISHPVFASAEAASIHGKCMANLRQLGQSLSLYTADNDDRYPPANCWRTVSEGYQTKSSPVQGPDPALRCPLSTSPWSYGFNADLSEVGGKDIVSPDKTVTVFDCDADVPDAAGGASSLSHRHGEVAGILFADGHVAFRPFSNLVWQHDR